MHGDEFLRGSRAEGMNSVGSELLAGAGLALNEHGRPRRSDLLDRLEDLNHRRRMADHAFQARASADLLTKFDVFAPGIPLAQAR